jgi:hypothetical protein
MLIADAETLLSPAEEWWHPQLFINQIFSQLNTKDASTAPARLPPSRGPPQAGLLD